MIRFSSISKGLRSFNLLTKTAKADNRKDSRPGRDSNPRSLQAPLQGGMGLSTSLPGRKTKRASSFRNSPEALAFFHAAQLYDLDALLGTPFRHPPSYNWTSTRRKWYCGPEIGLPARDGI